MHIEVGSLVRCVDGNWMVRAPTHCTAGHKLTPGRMVVGHVPCSCGQRGGHTTWACECGVVVYAPSLTEACHVLAGPAAVR
ncbi:hypothetical protein DE4576_04836 [Mycobacterium marinum]|nr:hypothetical protein DE4576_04836 [Mycobacterium marinum]